MLLSAELITQSIGVLRSQTKVSVLPFPESLSSCGHTQRATAKIGGMYYFKHTDQIYPGTNLPCPTGSTMAKLDTEAKMHHVAEFWSQHPEAQDAWVGLHNPAPVACTDDRSTTCNLANREDLPVDVSTYPGELKIDDSDNCVKLKKDLKLESEDCSKVRSLKGPRVPTQSHFRIRICSLSIGLI